MIAIDRKFGYVETSGVALLQKVLGEHEPTDDKDGRFPHA